MVEFFWKYSELIVFLHVISAVVWVGGMIAMRFAAHHSFMELDHPPVRIQRTSHALKRLFTIVTPFVILLLITAILLSKAYGGGTLVHIKEAIWVVMAANLTAMIFRRNKAEKLVLAGNFAEAKAKLEVIGKYMVPFNIVLGIIAIYLGVTLRYAH